MKAFRDNQEREWLIEISATSLKRVKASTMLDLTKLIDPDADIITRLAGDVVLLFDVLCALVRPQLDSKGLSDDEFGQALDEEALENAAKALFEAIIDFFPPQKRELLKRVFLKVTAAAARTQNAAVEQALRDVESEAFDQAIQQAMPGV